MSKTTVFTGTGVAIVTPMNRDGSVNFEKFRELVEWQIENGIEAIIACGTTGEASTLDDDEHIAVIKAAIEQARGRVPVIAGTGSNDTSYCVDLSLKAKELGSDALLLVTPYYNKTSQRGLIAHYNMVANEVKMPVILYNVPSRTALDIKPETYAELAKNPYIVGIKEANSNISSMVKTAALCGDNIDLYSGNDDQIVPILSLGGKGVISVVANVLPKKTGDITRRWFDGDIRGSCALQLELLDLINALFSDVNPIPVKEAMNMMGMNVGPCRMPLYQMDENGRKALADVLRRHGLIA
ncbi:MAG TPA: 4-hydroxy-tetrahydrodipicolinate synthase [Candidatus Avimonas sp.]|jgi:4-hydroxy-tetrahydrodipicolinate synthase|nr:4-hydroxy-tetrahydrodipicolinate synthase [Candidatus Avimonas sp.]HQA15405.1 4-hydroxy-tetrahydrodipicolinate synthase [Candidatus Avimonas sp.]HQD37365.1 4-hydroxy-tetrahydrodipicolinate synthase [Candidatus Avimonas sp.]